MFKTPNTGSTIGKANTSPQITADSPAFPFVVDIPHPMDPKTITRQVFVGLTVRDYFAAQALQLGNLGESSREIAEFAYRIADAMLKAREGGNDSPSQFHEDYMKPNGK